MIVLLQFVSMASDHRQSFFMRIPVVLLASIRTIPRDLAPPAHFLITKLDPNFASGTRMVVAHMNDEEHCVVHPHVEAQDTPMTRLYAPPFLSRRVWKRVHCLGLPTRCRTHAVYRIQNPRPLPRNTQDR